MPQVMKQNKRECRGKKRKRTNFNHKKKKRKIEPIVTTHEKCCFCADGPNQEMGVFFKDTEANIAAHQFCLLFSAGLPQLGNDDEGFDGFLLKDLLKETQRVSNIFCKFCRKPGANSGCCVSHCKMLYHYQCGLKEGLQFIYNGSFDTYCLNHRQNQDLSLVKTSKVNFSCPICLENIGREHCNKNNILKTPCCKNVFIHKNCIQRQATISGYFFRCPCCNNKDEFSAEMANYGIYIPSRDAAWEESNAFVDLLEEYDKCDLKKCKCNVGRKYSTKAGKWHLIRCYMCGQSAVHVKCLGKQYIPGVGYVCTDCNRVTKLGESNVNVFRPSMHERWREHKRRLLELTSRNDPVLLASSVFGKRIWFKQFNIKTCNVNVFNLKLVPSMKTVNINNVKKLLEQSKSNLENLKSQEASCSTRTSKPFKKLIEQSIKKDLVDEIPYSLSTVSNSILLETIKEDIETKELKPVLQEIMIEPHPNKEEQKGLEIETKLDIYVLKKDLRNGTNDVKEILSHFTQHNDENDSGNVSLSTNLKRPFSSPVTKLSNMVESKHQVDSNNNIMNTKTEKITLSNSNDGAIGRILGSIEVCCGTDFSTLNESVNGYNKENVSVKETKNLNSFKVTNLDYPSPSIERLVSQCPPLSTNPTTPIPSQESPESPEDLLINTSLARTRTCQREFETLVESLEFDVMSAVIEDTATDVSELPKEVDTNTSVAQNTLVEDDSSVGDYKVRLRSNNRQNYHNLDETPSKQSETSSDDMEDFESQSADPPSCSQVKDVDMSSYEEYLPVKKRRYIYRNFLGSHLVHRYHIRVQDWIRVKCHQAIEKNMDIEIVLE